MPFRAVVRDPRYQAACFSNLAQGWTSFGVRSSLIPVLVVEVLHRPASWTGIAFACAAVAQTIAVGPAGRFTDTVGRRPAMILGGTACRGIDHGRTVRTEHLAADRRALSRTASPQPSWAPPRRPRSAMRQGASEWHGGRGVLDVF